MSELEMIKDFFYKLEFKMNYNWGRANEWYRYKVVQYDGKLNNVDIIREHILREIEEMESKQKIENFDILDKITFNEFCYILGRWAYDTTFMEKYAKDILKFISYKYKITIPEPKDNYERIERENKIWKYTRDYVCSLNENESKHIINEKHLKEITNIEDIFYSYLHSIIDLEHIYRVNYHKCDYTFGIEYEVFILRSKDGERSYVIDLQMWD